MRGRGLCLGGERDLGGHQRGRRLSARYPLHHRRHPRNLEHPGRAGRGDASNRADSAVATGRPAVAASGGRGRLTGPEQRRRGGMPRTRADACGLGAGLSFLSTQACGQSPNFGGTFTDALSCLADLGTTASGPAAAFVGRAGDLGRAVGGGRRLDRLPTTERVPVARHRGRPRRRVRIAGSGGAGRGCTRPQERSAGRSWFRRSCPRRPARCLRPSRRRGSPPSSTAFGRQRRGGLQRGRSRQLADVAAHDPSTDDFGDSGCRAGIRDTDPTQPGLQADCTVDEEYVSASDGSRSESVVASCDVSGPPCWTFTPGSADVCPGRWLLTVDRGPDFCPQVSIETAVTCLGCVDPSDPACSGPAP